MYMIYTFLHLLIILLLYEHIQNEDSICEVDTPEIDANTPAGIEADNFSTDDVDTTHINQDILQTPGKMHQFFLSKYL